MSKDVIYKNPKNILRADVVEMNIKTKDTKIYMHDTKKKVKIKSMSKNEKHATFFVNPKCPKSEFWNKNSKNMLFRRPSSVVVRRRPSSSAVVRRGYAARKSWP